MRLRVISAAIVLVLAVGACVFSMVGASHFLDEIVALADEARSCAERGDTGAGVNAMLQMNGKWTEMLDMLEIVMPHEDFHDATAHIAEATRSLECGETDDFYAVLTLITQQVEHLRQHEAFTLTNIL